MKNDSEIIRAILEKLEECEDGTMQLTAHMLEGYDQTQVVHNMRLLKERNCVHGKALHPTVAYEAVVLLRLNPAGHDLLRSMRSGSTSSGRDS